MDYIISDIHGEYDLFLKLLQKINFSSKDKLFICGDIIDKGQDSIKLLLFIKSMPNFYPIIGNHEYSFLKHYWALMQKSPDDFDEVLSRLQSYFPHDGKLLDWETIDWLETLPYYIEEKDFICVHAGIPLTIDNNLLPLNKIIGEQFVYDRDFKDPNAVPITNKCIFFGHTPTSYICGEPKILKYKRQGSVGNNIGDYYKIHLDIGTWLCGEMACICIDTLEEFYV